MKRNSELIDNNIVILSLPNIHTYIHTYAYNTDLNINLRI